MKITFDTKSKTIQIDQETSLGELHEFMKINFPDNWKDYKLIPPDQVFQVPFYPTVPMFPDIPPVVTYLTTDA